MGAEQLSREIIAQAQKAESLEDQAAALEQALDRLEALLAEAP